MYTGPNGIFMAANGPDWSQHDAWRRYTAESTFPAVHGPGGNLRIQNGWDLVIAARI